MRDWFGRSPFLAGASPVNGIHPLASVVLELVHNGRVRGINAGLDSGMGGAHLEIPTTLAAELGLRKNGSMVLDDPSGRRMVDVATLDRVRIGSCSLDRVTVLYFDGAPVLIGDDLMRALGLIVTYWPEGVRVNCAGSRSSGAVRFPLVLTHHGRRREVDGWFDTAWESSDLAVPRVLAEEMSLEVMGVESAPAPGGAYEAPVSTIDRIDMRDVPGCGVENAKVKILPAGRVIVGEPFLRKTTSTVGYGPSGPVYGCRPIAE
jgi:hypothetical protein